MDESPQPPQPPEPPMSTNRERRWSRWLAGMLAGNFAMLAAYAGVAGMTYLLDDSHYDTAAIIFGYAIALPSIFLMPYFGGFAASYVWRTLNATALNTLYATFLMTLMATGGAMIFVHEGYICLIIAFPIIFLCQLAGAYSGKKWFKHDPTKLRLSIIPLLFLAVLIEPATRTPVIDVVTDQIVIHAPPSKVWPCVTSFPQIPAKPRYWLFRIGLPMPESTTSEGNFVGAKRACIFDDNDVFKEVVSEYVPEKKLTFDIFEIPKDPELLGHLTPGRGQFVLRDNHDGTTTLIGSTWYSLHVSPGWYFNWWTHSIFSAVHLRVMNDIKRRAEAAR